MKKRARRAGDIKTLFNRFKTSKDTLWIIKDKKLILRSQEKGIGALVRLLESKSYLQKKTVFDKIIGQAAALLMVYGKVNQVYAVIGSRQAAKIFRLNKIKYYFLKVVSHVLNQTKNNVCPFEKLSNGKKPREFYNCVKNIF